MRIKTSELSGLALDWAVDVASGNTPIIIPFKNSKGYAVYQAQWARCQGIRSLYSSDWAQGGPIIERMEIGIKRHAPCSAGREWEASPSITAKGAGGRWGYGPTPLIAAMRCYVASKLGDEVDVPDALTGG